MKHVVSCPSVSCETTTRLVAFVELLRRWSTRLNLVASGDLERVWERHVDDCLQLAPLMASGTKNAIDLGSGAGFPGLILALATGVHFDLIEASHRKGAFLREAIRVTAAPATVHIDRIEHALVAPASLVTARALAPLPLLLKLAAPLLAPGGECLFLKGAKAEEELATATTDWHLKAEWFPTLGDHGGRILRVRELSRV